MTDTKADAALDPRALLLKLRLLRRQTFLEPYFDFFLGIETGLMLALGECSPHDLAALEADGLYEWARKVHQARCEAYCDGKDLFPTASNDGPEPV